MRQELPDLIKFEWRLRRWTAGITVIAFFVLQIFPARAFADQDPIPTWLKEDKGGWLSAEKAQRMQKADQDLLAHLSTLEQAQQRFITTHPSGLQSLFVRPEPVEGQTPELVVTRDAQGNLLWAPTFNDYQRVQNGTLLLVDGTLQTVREGRLTRQVAVDNTETFFRTDGQVDYEISPDGTRTDYSYSGTGFTRTTHTPTGDLVQEYNAQGILATVTAGGFLYTYSSQTAADGTITASLSEARAGDGTVYTFTGGEVSAVRLPDGTRQTITAGAVSDVTLSDGRLFHYNASWLRQLQNAGITSNYSYTFDAGGNLATITVTAADGSSRSYSSAGTLQTITDPDKTRWTVVNGWITQSVSPAGALTTYTRLNTPYGQQILRQTGSVLDRFSFDAAGKLYAAGTDRNLAGATPFTTPLQSFSAGTLTAAGIVATDGIYLYVKAWGNSSAKTFTKVGTGIGGTVAGKVYGTLTGNVANTISATFFSDGFLYQPDPGNATRVEQINPVTGAKLYVTIPAGLLRTDTAKVEKGNVLITSDGRYVYNLSYHQTRNTTTLNGWTVRVFDPKNGWALVKEFTAGTTSFKVNGLMSDGTFLYALEWTNTNSARVAVIRISDGAVAQTWTANQYTTKAIGGQYDWVNQRFWWGAYTTGKVYAYKDPNSLPLSAWVEREGLRTPITQTQLADMSRLGQPVNTTLTDVANRVARDLPGLPPAQKSRWLDGLWDQAHWPVTPDLLPPTGSMELPALTLQREITLSLAALDPAAADGTTGSGVRMMRLSMNDGQTWSDPEPFAASKTLTLPEQDGDTTIQIQFQDTAGHWSDPVARTVTLDAIPPVLTLAAPDSTDAERYDFLFSADGVNQPPQQWRLGRGLHGLIAEATDRWDRSSRARFAIRRIGTLPEPTEPPPTPQGNLLTQRLADGTVATYANGLLLLITRPDGTRLAAPTLNAEGQVTAGWLTTPDGTLTYLENSAAVWSKTPLGAVYWYSPDQWLEAVRSADGTLTAFAYRLNDAGEVAAILISTAQESVLFTPDGRILQRVDAGGQPLPLDETTAPQAALSLLQDAQGRITGLSAQRDGITRTYNAAGELTSVTLADQTTLAFQNGNLEQVRLPDGARIADGVYDADSRLISGNVEMPDGRKIRYADGQPAEATLPDGSRIAYSAGQPATLTLPDGANYTLTLRQAQGDREASWEAVRAEPSSVRPEPVEGQSDSLTRMTYSADWILQESTRADGAVLRYVRPEPVEGRTDSSARLNTLTQPNGTVISYAYDSAGRIANTVAVSPDPAEPAIRSEYAYDRIRKIYKADQLLYDYSYEFELNGAEITVIHEIATGLTKRYRVGQLISQTDPDGAVTRYEYTADSAGYADPFETAVEAAYTLPDGTHVHYERTADPANPWKTVRFTLPDGTELSGWGREDHSLTPKNGVGAAPGKIGNAAHFTAADSQYLSAPDNPDLSTGNAGFTVAGWVYFDSNSAVTTVVSKGNDGMDYEFRLINARDTFRFIVSDGTGESQAVSNSFETPTTGTWYFLVGWYDAGAKKIYIQVNNGAVDSENTPANGTQHSTGPFQIGRYGTIHPMDGRIDDVGMWKRVLTAQERADLFNAGAGNTFRKDRHTFDMDSGHSLADRLVAYYNLDESTGTRADSTELSGLLAQAALPDDPAALRRMVEQGLLSLRGPTRAEAISQATSAPTLSRATLTYQGKERESFTYNYDKNLTRVTDEASVTRLYDAAHSLTAIEQPDGTRYSVVTRRDLSSEQVQALASGAADQTVFENPLGESVTVQALARRLLPDGTELTYDEGRLASLLLPDGRRLSSFALDANGVPLRGTIQNPNGSTAPFQNGGLIEVTRADGAKLRYRNNVIAEINLPVNTLQNATVSAITLDAQGNLASGEILLPSGDRLTLSGGRVTGARLADGSDVRSVSVAQDSLTGATLSVSGSSATLNNTRDVEVTLPSGQVYRYRYALDGAGKPTNTLETMSFWDDFEDGNAAGWSVQAGSDWTVTGGDLRGRDTEYGYSIATTGLNWADYTVTTRFNYESFIGPAKEVGLFYRWQSTGSYYMVRILDRSFQPDRHVGWVLEAVSPYFGERTIARLDGFNPSGDHTLSVQARGSTFDVYVDGQFKGSTSDGKLSRGTVGFGVNQSIARFHDLEVTFPGEDLRDQATRDVDTKLRDLRGVIAQGAGPISQIGVVAAQFNPDTTDPSTVRILEESSDPAIQAAVSAIHQATADPSLPLVSELNSQGQMVSSQVADGSITSYNESGRPIAQYDRDGRKQVDYRYDSNGRLVKTTLESARADLNDRFNLISQEVTRRQAEAARALAEKAGVINQELEIQVQVAREQLANNLTTLQGQLQSMESTKASGKSGKAQKAQSMDQMRGGIGQIHQAQDQLERQYLDALGQLRAEIASANQQVQQQTASSLAELQTQKETFLKGIIRQEILPIIGEVYRLTIGRDPNSETEVSQLVDELYAQFGGDPNASVNRDLLEQRIRGLSDYQQRVDQVAAIKQRVTDWLTRYTSLRGSEATEAISSLALTADQVVPLTQADADRILAWLNSSSLHFGHSAFLALKEYLAAQGIEVDATSLAVQAIQIDILVGVINPKTTGDLELSLFSLQRVARLHGGSAFSARVGFDDLRSLVTSPVIAHVNGNHYIVVLAIAADGTVTYREPNQGPTGQTLTMSQPEFLKAWKGVILAARAPPQAWQLLTDREAQAIRGSFIILIAFILFVISTGLQFVQNDTVQLIGKIIGYIAIAISVFNLAYQLASTATMTGIKAAFSGFSNGLVSGLQTLGHSIWQGLIQVAHTLFDPSELRAAFHALTPVAGEAAKATLPQFIATTVFATGVNYGITKGLDALGVDSTISSLAGAFTSGAILGGLSHGSTQTFLHGAVAGAVTNTAIAGTQIGLVKAGLDPALASIASIGIGTITSSLTSGVSVPGAYDPITHQPIPNSIIPWHTVSGLNGLGYTFSTQIAPTLAGELAFYGVQKLGESIGLDPRISVLAGIPIRNGISSYLTRSTSEQIMKSIGAGLVRGATSVGLQFAAEGLDLDPLVGSLATAGISGSIEAMLEGQSPVKGIYDTYFNSATGLLTLGGPGATSYEKALYLSKINDFSQIIREQGIGQALETYAASILHRQTIENIWKLGGIYDLLANRDQIEFRTSDEGIPVKRIYVDSQKRDYIDLALDNDRLLGMREGNVISHCEFGIGPDGRSVMRNGEKETVSNDGKRVKREVIKDFKLVEVSFYDLAGKKTEEIVPLNGDGIAVDKDGNVINGIRINKQAGITAAFLEGRVIKLTWNESFIPNADQKNALLRQGFSEDEMGTLTRISTYVPIYGKHQLSVEVITSEGNIVTESSEVWSYLTRALAGGLLPEPKTTVSLDRNRGVAQVDMDLTWPDPKLSAAAAASLVLGSVGASLFLWTATNNINWSTATRDTVTAIGSLLGNGDASFIFGPGVNSNGLTLDQIAQLKASLGTDKKIVVAHSAFTEAAVREMFTIKADKYILASPRMDSFVLAKMIQDAGVGPERVIVITTRGDFPSDDPLLGNTSYIDHAAGHWTSIHIEDGPGVGWWPFASHSVPIDGWLNGKKYNVEVNGKRRDNVTLAEVYRDAIRND